MRAKMRSELSPDWLPSLNGEQLAELAELFRRLLVGHVIEPDVDNDD